MIRLAFLLIVASCANAEAGRFNGRIVGGHETTIDKFPHQVSIQSHGQHLCGGSIITEKHILTAANCFASLPSNKTAAVRVGTTNRLKGGIIHTIEKVKISPDFNATSLDFDVAVVILDRPIHFSNTTRPINLVTKTDQPQKGDKLTISGWGYKKGSDFGDFPETLQAVTISYTDFDFCRSVYVWYRKNVTQNMFCAGNTGPSAYRGDYGGGIVNAKTQLVGIASWGVPDCCPTVFTNVLSPKVRNFINGVIH